MLFTSTTRFLFWPIAIGQNKNLVVEVKSIEPSAQRTLTALSEALKNRDGWELRVYYVAPASVPKPIDIATPSSVQRAINAVVQLAEEDRLEPALLMAWSTFEALGRILLPEKFSKPQTPARLIEVLASYGQLTPTEADKVRELATVRNRLIHGGLETPVSKPSLLEFIDVLRTLSNLPALT